MILYPRTLVCCCRFNTVFIFISNLNKYQNIYKSITANIVSWLGKTVLMSNYWPSQSVLSWMSLVRNREIRNMVFLSTFGLLFTCFFCVGFLYKFVVCIWLKKKTTVLFICIHKWDKSIYCFRHVRKILLWIGTSEFKCCVVYQFSFYKHIYIWIEIFWEIGILHLCFSHLLIAIEYNLWCTVYTWVCHLSSKMDRMTQNWTKWRKVLLRQKKNTFWVN